MPDLQKNKKTFYLDLFNRIEINNKNIVIDIEQSNNILSKKIEINYINSREAIYFKQKPIIYNAFNFIKSKKIKNNVLRFNIEENYITCLYLKIPKHILSIKILLNDVSIYSNIKYLKFVNNFVYNTISLSSYNYISIPFYLYNNYISGYLTLKKKDNIDIVFEQKIDFNLDLYYSLFINKN
jgi:hypothetical protein